MQGVVLFNDSGTILILIVPPTPECPDFLMSFVVHDQSYPPIRIPVAVFEQMLGGDRAQS